MSEQHEQESRDDLHDPLHWDHLPFLFITSDTNTNLIVSD